jgi:predicted ATPase
MNKFQIGNFKAFSDLQTIPLKPITIIFGPNSSGKSSVIHSLLLARHGVDTQGLDATYPSIAGHSVDLGGFRQYVHRRNLENRLQWVAEMSVSSLPAKLASDLAKADTLSVHMTAGLQLGYNGQPVAGAVPFTQTCEYRIDGEPFLQLTRGAPQTDFRVTRLNREHAVFEPILQAMLLSSKAQAALNEEDSKLLNELIDSIVPNLAFPGTSDFLPGADLDPDLLDSVSRPALYDKDEEQFAKLGDLGRSVRLFLPRMLTRFHSGVHQALTGSLKSLSYLGPLRAVPPRHMAFAETDTFGHPAEGAQAWRELGLNAAVRDKVNAWLSDETKLKTPYRLELESFFSQQTVSDIVENLQEDVANWSIQDFLRSLPTESDFLKRYLEHGQEDNPDWGELDSELADLVSEHSDLEEAFKEWIAPRLSDLLTERQESGSADVRLYDIQKRTPVSHRDVGIGVSQVLPVLVQAYAANHGLIAMEQPEIHLHPALQAELGDVFIESALGKQQNRFVLETHSEHLILRILRRIRESAKQAKPTITASDVAVLYVEPSPDGAEVYEMEISKDGQIVSQWPGGFFPERMKEMFGGDMK